jgi:hypothetical protein
MENRRFREVSSDDGVTVYQRVQDDDDTAERGIGVVPLVFVVLVVLLFLVLAAMPTHVPHPYSPVGPPSTGKFCEMEEGYMGQKVIVCHER